MSVEGEDASLRAALEACAAVSLVDSLRPHHKGGFVAVLSVKDGAFDSYVEHMKDLG